jgi:serine protease
MRRTAVALTSISSAGLLLATLLATTATAEEHNPARTRPTAETQATVQRVIVKFRSNSGLSTQATTNGESANVSAVSASRMNALASRARISVQASRALSPTMQVMQISPLTNNETASETLARLRADSDVEIAELDRLVYPHATSNDPLATGQWYLQATQPSATNANAAWDITKGSNGVVVAVVDTGVIYGHPDLLHAGNAGKLLPGYDFVSADPGGIFRTANDSDGRDSDPSDPGDWVSSSDGCGQVGNSSWHGTRVSGIISALTDNSTGLAGMMWKGFILPVRVLGKCGGYNSDVLAGIRWAAGFPVPGVPANPYPARIINVSLGGQGACDTASSNVISEVNSAGILVVVSAGNEGGPVDSPANCPGAMAIAGLRHAGTKVGFSSLGPQVAIGAPGGNCVNINGGPCLFSIDTTSNSGTTVPTSNTYTSQTETNVGTSFSSPIVSGIAGLMLAVNGNLKSRQLIARMQEGATRPFPTSSETPNLPTCHVPVNSADIQNTECLCTTNTCGAGMANANGAVLAAFRPIAAVAATPISFTAGQTVTLNASGSAAACNRNISSYAWTVQSGSVTLSSTNASSTTFQAPSSGLAVVRVTVTDEEGRTDFADMTISSSSASSAAPANAGSTACLTDIVRPSAPGPDPNVVAVSISATDPAASETNTDVGVFMLTRSGPTQNALAVTITMSGSATSGTDYQPVAASVTIPAGAITTSITVTPVDDATVDASETIIATVQDGNAYDAASPTSATITITDNDAAAPPPAGNDGGGGGGGRLDLLALLMLGGILVIHAQLHRQKRRLRAVF